MFYLFFFFFFFFNDTPTTEIYTLSLHDALPISDSRERELHRAKVTECAGPDRAKDLFSLESTMDHFVVGDPNVVNDGSQRSATDPDDDDDDEMRSEEHTSELQSHSDLVCRLLLEKKNK